MSFLTGGNKSWPLHNMMIQLILYSSVYFETLFHNFGCIWQQISNISVKIFVSKVLGKVQPGFK